MTKTFFIAFATIAFISSEAQVDTIGLNKVFGRKGTVTESVYRVTFVRSDLKLTIGDFAVSPGFALTSWVALDRMKSGSMMMGDLVMLDSEEPLVVAKLVSLGLGITAIHNHLVGEQPAVKFLHFYGEGDALDLAAKIKQVILVTATPMNVAVFTPPPTPDWSAVEAILGTKGKKNANVISYGFPRKEKLMDHGMEMQPAMGMATGVNFQMDGARAATTGDFVLMASEVNNVVKALQERGITVTAIHNHMLYDEPRLFMMHFWGVGAPGDLAQAIKEALDQTNSKR